MFDPFDDDEDSAEKPRPPFPTPTSALLLTFGASFASVIVAVLFFEEIDVLALGVGEALGVGGVATFAARRVPDPQPERLGLRGFSPRLLPVLLCLVPLVFLTSELDNVGRTLDGLLPPLGIESALVDAIPGETAGDLGPGGPPETLSTTTQAGADDASKLDDAGDDASISNDATDDAGGDGSAPILTDPPEGWALAQVAIVTLGISPVVEGFLFFGVILQGLVTWLGRRRGLLLTGCLYAMIHAFGQAGADAGVFQSFSAIASFIGMGVALGVTRLATGSVLAPILLETCFRGVALVAMTSPDLLAVPGYNVALDAHTPLSVVLPAAASVAWGIWILETRSEHAAS